MCVCLYERWGGGEYNLISLRCSRDRERTERGRRDKEGGGVGQKEEIVRSRTVRYLQSASIKRTFLKSAPRCMG